MKKINKLIFTFILFVSLVAFPNAQSVKEDVADYADSDKIIIGNTRFDGDVVVNVKKVVEATQNQTRLDIALGMSLDEALKKEVTVYFYNSLIDKWYIQEEKFVAITDEDEIKTIEENLDIFFVNNEEKVLEFEYEGEGEITGVTEGVKYENGKFKVPATTFTFEFKEDGEFQVVYTEPESKTDDELNYGSFDVVAKTDVVATVGTMQFDNLQDAVNASTTANPAKLLKDLTVSEIIELKGEEVYNVLDLGGHTLTSTAAEVIMVNGVNNTLKITNGNIVSSNGATLYVGTKEQNQTYNKLIVDKNVKISAETYGIYVVGDNSELDFNGELSMTTEESIAILGSGNTPCANTIIKIGKDSKIDATQKGSFALYLPQAGVVTIDGGNIKGDTVVGIKAGTLTINGGTLTATGQKVSPEGYNNGMYSTGDVIIIEENEGYADNINITVADEASLTSTNGYIIQEHLYTGTNRAKVYGKYATANKLETGAYYTAATEAVFEHQGLHYSLEYLEDALNASTETNPVTLLKDLTISEIIKVNKENTYNVLDLGGHTLTSTAAEVIMINGVNNTLKITNGNIVSSNDATLYVGSKTQDGNYNKLIVDQNVKITAEGHGIYLVGDKSELDFNGELVMTGESNAISGNGTAGWGNTIITIGANAKVTANGDNSFALYLPQAGTVTINGGTFEANTVIGIKAGTLTINGGTFKATGAKVAPSGYNNGINATGDVITIEENEGYADNIKINVADEASLTSTNGYVIQEYLYTGTNRAKVTGKYAAINNIDTGAYFTETEKAQAKVAETVYGTLKEALANATKGETVTVLNNVKYENCNEAPLKYRAEDTNIAATLDLNGKTITAELNNAKNISLLSVGNINPDKKNGTATITIKDSSTEKNGTLKALPNLESDGWDVSVATVMIERLGRVTLESGNIIISTEGLSAEENPYGIDVLTNTGAQTAELTINGGYIESKSSSGMGVRLSANSSKAAIKFVMNDGEIVGAPDGRGIWFHQTGGRTYNLIDATINGGKVTADRALELGDFNLDEVETENIQITINGGEFNSTNTNNNPVHPECADFFTGKSTTYYNQTFNHIKLVDNRAQ